MSILEEVQRKMPVEDKHIIFEEIDYIFSKFKENAETKKSEAKEIIKSLFFLELNSENKKVINEKIDDLCSLFPGFADSTGYLYLKSFTYWKEVDCQNVRGENLTFTDFSCNKSYIIENPSQFITILVKAIEKCDKKSCDPTLFLLRGFGYLSLQKFTEAKHNF